MPSTVIADYEYDEAQSILRITFITGRVYEYEDVPPAVAAEFRSAGSRGAYFNRNIRGAYAYREVARAR
jgi:hypothetical protein